MSMINDIIKSAVNNVQNSKEEFNKEEWGKGKQQDREFNMVYDFVVVVFRDRVSLCIPGCPGAHSVDQAGLELRDLQASAS